MATINFFGGRIVLGTEFAGYKIGIFEAGTSTAKTTYTDSALTAGNENTAPVVLDANGAAQIWFSGNAKAIFYTSADVVVYTDDNVNLEASSSATGADNLILNGSFEDDADADGVPDNWTKTLYSGGAFTVDTTTQMHGSTSAKFTSTGTGGGYLTSTSTYAIKPSAVYTVGFSLKSSVADVRNVVTVYWYKADGTASATASTDVYDDSTTNPTSWTEKWYEATSPSDAYFAKYRLTGCHSSDATSGSTWFDDVIFMDGFKKRANNTVAGTITMSAKSLYTAEGAAVASVASCNIWTGDGNARHITGTTQIDDFATAPQAGAWQLLIFDDAVLLNHSANLNLVNAVDYTTRAGQMVLVYADTTTQHDVFPISVNDLTIGTATATTSGTSHDVTGIPSWVKKITIPFSGISTNGTSSVIVQIGDSGGFETTTYDCNSAFISTPANVTAGFPISNGAAATDARSGVGVLTLVDPSTNQWVWSCLGNSGQTTTNIFLGAGTHDGLDSALTQIRLTTVNGTDAFDAGKFNVLYE